MNERIRGLQQNVKAMHEEADGLLSKAAPSAEETRKGLELIERIKTVKAEIDVEFAAARGLKELEALRNTPATGFQQAGRAQGDVAHLGMKAAGATTIDSFGTVLSEVGEGVFGSKAVFEHVHTPEYKRAFVAMLRKKGLQGLRDHEFKAIQEGLDDQGGAFVPADVLMRIVARKPTPTRVAGMCTNLTTGRDRMVMPRQAYSADDLYTTAFRASWTGEAPASDPDVNDAGLSGNVEVPVFTAMLSASVTNDMIEDAGFPIMTWLEDQLRVTMDLLRDDMVLNGSGKGQPLGMLAAAGLAGQPGLIDTAAAHKLAADDLRDLSYAVPEQYDENCSFVLNKTNTARAVSKLKDGHGRYLFGYGVQDSGMSAGRPKELAGYPFAYSGFMPNLQSTAGAALTDSGTTVTGVDGATPILFGDLLGYYLVNRLGLTLQVLRETKAKRNQVEVVGRVRFGGRTVEPWRIKLLRIKAA